MTDMLTGKWSGRIRIYPSPYIKSYFFNRLCYRRKRFFLNFSLWVPPALRYWLSHIAFNGPREDAAAINCSGYGQV